MPVEIFLKLDGINGGTRNFSRKGCSDVSSWSWEMQSNRNASRMVEGEKIACKQISIVKRIGMDSPDIMSLFVQGKTIASADLEIIPIVSKRESRQKYLSIRMEDVRIKSILAGGSATEEQFNETILLLFGKVRLEFSTNTMPNTDIVGADFRFAWDIANNREWQ